MNREIKFRAIVPINIDIQKRMEYFDLCRIDDINRMVDADFSINQLMQFTGLIDKNGTEIYEGDILSDRWKVEVYQNDEGTFMVKFHTNPEINRPISLKKYLLGRETAGTLERDCIIIGNIYQNPELIK
jgi:uncharacterized phage protein (TIGR01671 family)